MYIWNKTGLQPVSKPVEQVLLGFKTAEEKSDRFAETEREKDWFAIAHA